MTSEQRRDEQAQAMGFPSFLALVAHVAEQRKANERAAAEQALACRWSPAEERRRQRLADAFVRELKLKQAMAREWPRRVSSSALGPQFVRDIVGVPDPGGMPPAPCMGLSTAELEEIEPMVGECDCDEDMASIVRHIGVTRRVKRRNAFAGFHRHATLGKW